MWHKPCRTFNPWCLCIKTRCLFTIKMPSYQYRKSHCHDNTILSTQWISYTGKMAFLYWIRSLDINNHSMGYEGWESLLLVWQRISATWVVEKLHQMHIYFCISSKEKKISTTRVKSVSQAQYVAKLIRAQEELIECVALVTMDNAMVTSLTVMSLHSVTAPPSPGMKLTMLRWLTWHLLLKMDPKDGNILHNLVNISGTWQYCHWWMAMCMGCELIVTDTCIGVIKQ